MELHNHRNVSNLISILIDERFCSTNEEADAIAHAVAEDIDESEQGLQDYLGISSQVAQHILRRAFYRGSEESDSLEEDKGSDSQENSMDGDNDNDYSAYLGEGECELCERSMRLTRHHLVPRCTWSRLEPRLLRALETRDRSNENSTSSRNHTEGLEHLLESIHILQYTELTPKQRIRRALQTTCDICRPCHTTIHRIHDNMTLALHYNTIDKLLGDSTIYSFCQWASKQRRGKFGLSYSRR